MGKEISMLERLASFMEGGTPPAFETFGTHVTPVDDKVYNLSTPQGRAAWQQAASEGEERTILEDGATWLRVTMAFVSDEVATKMEELRALP